MDTAAKLPGFSTANAGLPRSAKAVDASNVPPELRALGLGETAQPRPVGETEENAALGQSKDGKPDAKQLGEAVKGLNEFFQSVRRTLQFSLDQESGRMVVQIKDLDTNKVIRQIPGEDVLKLAKRLDEIRGLIFEEKA